jgi:hypothetical protein
MKLHVRVKCYDFYRFVRFVSTPEVLERVYTTESEILQIEEAIAIQGNNDMGLSTVSKFYQLSIILVSYCQRKVNVSCFLCGR